ncbi:MAG: asparagine--tRNA ligase [candidate division WOR-3 bacterium]|nr:MAG: asparagine--tRNA ligase [candidate division WOR-3 bacterium]
MQQDALIDTIGKHQDGKVTLKGWVYNKRSSGKIRFVLLRDGTGIIQCVFLKNDVPEHVFDLADSVTQESSVEVTGLVRADARAPGGFELTADGLKLIQLAEPYPITPKEHGVDFLMKNRHLWFRSARQVAVLRIRNEIIKALRGFLDDNGFLCCDTPILTPAACEGTTTLFELDYFGATVYLAQSGQLYNEPLCAAVRKTYCFGPTFRAEKSKTRRHLMEFWMLEPEVAFLDLAGSMELAEELVAHTVARVLDKRKQDLETLGRDLSGLEAVRTPFPRLSYADAIDLLRSKGRNIEFGDDFGAEEETVLGQSHDRPVIVHRYPAAVKAFYMKRDESDPSLALAMDMISSEGYGEIIGGGQREEDRQKLEASIKQHRLPQEAFEWYLDLRRYGSFPHSGFGLGLERFVAWITGVRHIRETIPFPRMLEKVYP